MKPIIEVQGLSKKYQITANNLRYLSLRDSMTDFFKFKKRSEKEDFWALKDIDFKVEAGESIGIIGRNGAGKSTLLKILSRITPPTKGNVILRGRIASLLEVGTGFHPELTGRENVYFNGSILGLKKAEIDKKFDEIIDFSGVEQFINTPLKHYSSGMKLRLAFSVAAHLEPEILIIDEVLAVGDAEFQKKCLGKMDDVAKSGRTVLFVSHNLAAVEKLCKTAILLNNGAINIIADSKIAISNYLTMNNSISLLNDISKRKDRKGNGLLKFTSLKMYNSITNEELSEVPCGSDVKFRFFFKTTQNKLKNISLSIGLNDHNEQRISFLSTDIVNYKIDELLEKNNYIDLLIPQIPLVHNRYSLTLYCTVNKELSDWIQNAFYFDICSGDFFRTGKELPNEQGHLLINHSFSYS